MFCRPRHTRASHDWAECCLEGRGKVVVAAVAVVAAAEVGRMMESMVGTCSLRPIDQISHDEGGGGDRRLACVPIGQASRAVSSHPVTEAH